MVIVSPTSPLRVVGPFPNGLSSLLAGILQVLGGENGLARGWFKTLFNLFSLTLHTKTKSSPKSTISFDYVQLFLHLVYPLF